MTLFVVGMCPRVTTASESERRDMEMEKDSIKMIKMIKMKRGKDEDKGERKLIDEGEDVKGEIEYSENRDIEMKKVERMVEL